ncbi:MAG: hypothetical protein IPP73_03905 [Chitinophagaceae bacterium]|nr:hypothetical protein [Chitinophagaceae bacterium]
MKNIKKADGFIWDKIQKDMVILSVKEDTGILKDKKIFIRQFENLTVLDACILLEQLKTNIVFNFRRLVLFCKQSTRKYHDVYGGNRLIVGQNQTSFLPGEKLEITSGVGEFSNASLPSHYRQ